MRSNDNNIDLFNGFERNSSFIQPEAGTTRWLAREESFLSRVGLKVGYRAIPLTTSVIHTNAEDTFNQSTYRKMASGSTEIFRTGNRQKQLSGK